MIHKKVVLIFLVQTNIKFKEGNTMSTMVNEVSLEKVNHHHPLINLHSNTLTLAHFKIFSSSDSGKTKK